MQYGTAITLGFIGSLHCAVMCGPLMLAMPRTGNSTGALLVSRLVYNGGRILTYAVMGTLFGLLGQGVAMAGFQRWVSLAAGLVILASLFASGWNWNAPAIQSVQWLKTAFRKLLQKRSLTALFTLGALNGLLPCGLVYVAGAAAGVTASWSRGALYMAAFGLGTLPMMLGLGVAGGKLLGLARMKLQRLIPASVAMVGILLVLRGLALGIDYVSPAATDHVIQCPRCSQHP